MCMIKIPCENENVIIRLSGGADSAILLYLICLEWLEHNKPLTVWPVTVVHGVRHWQGYHAQQVYDWIQEVFEEAPITFKPLRSWVCEDPGGNPGNKNANNYVDFQERLIDEVVAESGRVCQVFNGVTANPPIDIGEEHWGSSPVFGEKVWECREKHRDWEVRHDRKTVDVDSRRNIVHCNPFIQHHKGHVAELYRKHDLVDQLLPLTRSCEGWTYMTEGFTEECGECWWCMEKKWAFNVHGKETTPGDN